MKDFLRHIQSGVNDLYADSDVAIPAYGPMSINLPFPLIPGSDGKALLVASSWILEPEDRDQDNDDGEVEDDGVWMNLRLCGVSRIVPRVVKRRRAPEVLPALIAAACEYIARISCYIANP